MNVTETLEKLIRSFEIYYNIKREGVEAPFAAEAEFHSHSEQYFLVKSARLSEAESNEYVYFAVADQVDEEVLCSLSETAWERGLSHITPHADHRNSDVTLFVISENITEKALKLVPKLRHYKSYRFGFQGWSHYRLVAIELSSGRVAYNRQGQSLKKLVCNII